MNLSTDLKPKGKPRAVKIQPHPRSIILDKIHPREFNSLNVIYCCEQCSYFNTVKKTCAMGFRSQIHMREAQLAEYSRSGRMAICRSLEID